MVDQSCEKLELIAHHLSEALALADSADLLVTGALISDALHEVTRQAGKE